MSLGAEAEARILDAYRSGDRPRRDAAFEELFEALEGDVRSLCRHVAGSDGEDALQETFLAVHTALPRFRGEARLTTWVWRIAMRTALRERAKRARKRTASLPRDVETRRSDPARAVAEADRVAAAMAKLSAEQRALLALAALEDARGEDIAAALGVPLGTVWSRIHSARKKLREALGGEV